ncbi:MAG TPA: hypothetical protein VGO55_03200 [Allosphingosinicella sp.]|nr:hypothetical protein [Allosphingosinicella sp.]
MIRAGDVAEREMFEAELTGEHDAGRVLEYEVKGAFEAGVAFLLADAPDQLAELEAMLAAEKEIEASNSDLLRRVFEIREEDRPAFLEKETRRLPDNQRQDLEEIRRLVAKYWPDYRSLMAQQARRVAMLPLEAFRRFCVGWEGLKQPFQAGPDGLVTLEAAGGVAQNDMKSAGLHAYRLLYGAVTEEGRKNSSAPAKSGSARKTSPSGAKSTKKAGRSRVSAGSKTPG